MDFLYLLKASGTDAGGFLYGSMWDCTSLLGAWAGRGDVIAGNSSFVANYENERGWSFMSSVHHSIRRDIQRCKEALESSDVKMVNNLLSEFRTAYSMYWDDLNFVGPTWWDDSMSYAELRGFMTRLESLLKLNAHELASLMNKNKNINISNTNIASNHINIEFKTLIQTTMEYFEDNETISDAERAEILSNINMIKEIGESGESKVKKWAKLKPILNWIATKGVDIFLKLLPLLIKAIEQN